MRDDEKQLKPETDEATVAVGWDVSMASNDLPMSKGDAQQRANAKVGLWLPITFRKARDRWWDRLVKANSAEDKLACQWMIDALGYAAGLNAHESGRALAAGNCSEAEERRKQAAMNRALDRWR